MIKAIAIGRRASVVAALLVLFSSRLYAEPRAVRVGVFPAAPLVIVDGDRPTGLFIDLLEHFARELDWNVDYVRGTWSEHLAGLERGELDLLPAVGFTQARTSIYDFSKNPVYIDSGVLFTRPRVTLHTIYDLQGKRVAAVRGSTFTTGFVDYLASFGISCDIALTDDNDAVMRAVADGGADAGVCIYSLGTELARSYPVVVTPISFSPIALHFAVPKGRDADILAGIDRLMPGLIEDPRSAYGLAFRKWAAPHSRYAVPTWIRWAFLVALGIGGVMGSLAFVLKRQVAQKTEHLRAEILEHERSEEELGRSLREKEILLRELYHRTKNTLQLIRSFMTLEAGELAPSDDIDRLVRKTEDRIQAVSLVHEMLYKSRDLSRIPIKDYVGELAGLIVRGFDPGDGRVSLDLAAVDRPVLLDTAIPLGLIINELAVNSIKHAFEGRAGGRISISIAADGADGLTLDYRDDGVGTPDGFDFRGSRTLGLRLIFGIGETQLGGSVEFRNEGGLRCVLRMPNDLYQERV